MRAYYFHEIDRNGLRPATVCLLFSKRFWSRGTAICSPRDTPNVELGERIAYGRARKAMALRRNISKMRGSAGFWKGEFLPDLSEESLTEYCRHVPKFKQLRGVKQEILENGRKRGIDPMMEWTPIKERLPEYSGRIGNVCIVNLLLADESGGVWPGDYTDGKFIMVSGVEHKHITHWMPYPNAPIPEKETPAKFERVLPEVKKVAENMEKTIGEET